MTEEILEVDYAENPTYLYRCVEQRDWKGTILRTRHSPLEAQTWVFRRCQEDDECPGLDWRTLPIHQACARGCPVTVLYVLLNAFPNSISMRDLKGNLPIHYACNAKADMETIHTLLVLYPESLDEKDCCGISSRAMITENNYGFESLEVDFFKNPQVVKEKKKAMTDFSCSSKVENEKVMEEKLPGWKTSGLSIAIIGASGDLAKKKTYPSLFELHAQDLLPKDTMIWGYARSQMTNEDLRNRLRPYLLKSTTYKRRHEQDGNDIFLDSFLSSCFYIKGNGYGDMDAFAKLNKEINQHELEYKDKLTHNRLFYFAIPPNVFAQTGLAIKKEAMAVTGWTRCIVEKPFGRDLKSCNELLKILDENFSEDQLYRIDHYLGKEMVQNLIIMRFSNRVFERLWSRDDIENVMITFKEPFGTDGRGGYFDKYGIIRDIIQNHLMQVLSLFAMEAPTTASGPESSDHIRNEKVKVLKAIAPITIDDVYLGQYEGYKDDPTLENKETNTPTFAAVRLFINNPRWAGVPFILKAGKALNERKAEMRIQFKDTPAAGFLFNNSEVPRNELVIRMQPEEAIYMKTNFKSPGFSNIPVQGELEVNYDTRYFSVQNTSSSSDSSTAKKETYTSSNPDAYTRLILNVIQGRQAAFVRDDELRRSWEVFTPLLNHIENENIKPHSYKSGSRGPDGADQWIQEKSGYLLNTNYTYYR
eukprot:CAMPEP_0178950092 /NCGR_PEP_ID=MMETSP0789-20121207/6449_1 /TAXON_ID=3005 /ORGANISM="Rhizosolenia setigera, Strain CCMP 1694" /LENGTH=702 /DNA_ID=CAMNT_0020630757 /DNA_START=53 /DNA_END=2161 /DNA_ORIENTATION=-